MRKGIFERKNSKFYLKQSYFIIYLPNFFLWLIDSLVWSNQSDSLWDFLQDYVYARILNIQKMTILIKKIVFFYSNTL